MGSRIEVWMDGGIRSGQDVLKAVALGAKGTLIGRAFLYGLGAYGEAGVTQGLEIIRNELDLTMAFCGRTRHPRRGSLDPAARDIAHNNGLRARTRRSAHCGRLCSSLRYWYSIP